MRTRVWILIFTLLAVATVAGCSLPARREAPNTTRSKLTEIPLNSATPRTIPERTGYVNDLAGVLDPQAKDRLEQLLEQKSNETQIELAVLTVESTKGISASDYSLEVAREWNIGSSRPGKMGALLLVSIGGRTWHIQTSRTLEKIVSDDEAAAVGKAMTPFFKQEKWGDGIEAGLEEFYTIAKKTTQADSRS